MTEDFLELTYVGGLNLEKITLRKTAISSVQKPKSDKYGCIIQVMTEKFPVEESYEFVCKAIGAKEI